MPNSIVRLPEPVNEPILSYAPGSPEKAALKQRLASMMSEQVEIPVIVGGREIRTGNTMSAVCPHDHQHALGTVHQAGAGEGDQDEAATKDGGSAWEEVHKDARRAESI